MTTRGGFLSSAAAIGAAAIAAPAFPAAMVKPPMLRRGDRVGLVAPASPVEPDDVNQGMEHLASLGLVPVLGAHARAQTGYLAGSDAQRAADFNAMARDASIRAIVALRGGYGTMRILDALDFDAIRRNPKIVMGYSESPRSSTPLRRAAASSLFTGRLRRTARRIAVRRGRFSSAR